MVPRIRARRQVSCHASAEYFQQCAEFLPLCNRGGWSARHRSYFGTRLRAAEPTPPSTTPWQTMAPLLRRSTTIVRSSECILTPATTATASLKSPCPTPPTGTRERNSDRAKLLPPSAYVVLNFRDAAPPSPRGALANATPRRFPLRLITRNLSSGI